MKTVNVFNIQRFSIHDGPGIRTTVFLKGCPLRCAWCHNPESFDPRPELAVADHRCVGCDLCTPVCDQGLTGPVLVGSFDNRPTDQCERCGQCADACPTEARQLLGDSYTVSRLLDEISKDEVYHQQSKGGITFSGGEPLSAFNAEFVLDCLEYLKNKGVHTTIDTCGHVKQGILARAAKLADLFLFDLKIMDSQKHRQATGQDNHLILDNLTYLMRGGKKLKIRVPLIPGMTDSRGNLEAMAAFLKKSCGSNPLPVVHLLPYHRVASEKYQRLGRAYTLDQVDPMTDSEINDRAGWLKNHGLTVHIGG